MTLYAPDRIVKGDSIVEHIQLIDFSVISKLENDLEPHETMSLVFLLYDEPYVALEKLKLFANISGSTTRPNMDLLLHWAMNVQSIKPMWRYELLEALCICHLYSNIRKLDFDVSEVKKHFVPGNVHLNIYIHPMKKVLYKICEELTSDKLRTLKRSLQTFGMTCDQTDIAEITFLQLICKKFITLGSWQASKNTRPPVSEFSNVNDFTKILKGMGCKELSADLLDVQTRLNGEPQPTKESLSLPGSSNKQEMQDTQLSDFSELYKNFAQFLEEGEEEESQTSPHKIKMDASSLPGDAYKIIDPSDIGICYIINQVNFYPSLESLRLGIDTLEVRLGSNKDRDELEKTFANFGFTVVIDENLDHSVIKNHIQTVITERVKNTHSAFVLCILSHGMTGKVFGIDSIPVKVSEIQDILYSDRTQKLIGKPKIMLIQACQGTDEAQKGMFVTDGPNKKVRAIPLKSDLVTYWATVPGHVSYRHEEDGSIFIQLLCQFLIKHAYKDHLLDIFTLVNGFIMEQVVNTKTQVPCYNTTLRKKIYFLSK